MTEPQAAKASARAEAQAQDQGATLLDKIINTMTPSPEQRPAAKDALREFIDGILKGSIVYQRDTERMVKAYVAEIDKKISAQLNEVMHASEFQKLEASWRGLHYLVHQSETSTMLKIRVFNMTKKELINDLERAPEFDQSEMFKKIYTEEYSTFGGSPYGLLVGDYEITNHPQDIEMLSKMSGIAASSHAPFVTAASSIMFGLDSFTTLNVPRDLSKTFDSVQYTKWRSFRESDDSKYVGLCVPHILMRLPYGKDNVPVESFNFEEDVDGKDHAKYLWGNAAYAFAARTTDAFAKYSWCTAIRGVEGGGLVQDLPTHTFRTDEGDIALKCPTEVAMDERREKELEDNGFISLVHCKGRDFAAFFSAHSANKPKKYDKDFANANARLSSQLQYMLAVSRFAHYMKAMMRDKVGSFMSRGNVETFLNRWISQYVLLDDDASQEIKARHPLREARIEVQEVPGKPGVYKAISYLRPHFQLEEIDVSLRLVAELPQGQQK